MSRSTSFVGLKKQAYRWLKKYCTTQKIKVITTQIDLGENDDEIADSKTESVVIRRRLISNDTGKCVDGMFGEKCHEFQEYTTKAGAVVEEYVQEEQWASGPVIFLALRFKESKEPVKVSLWSEKEVARFV